MKKNLLLIFGLIGTGCSLTLLLVAMAPKNSLPEKKELALIHPSPEVVAVKPAPKLTAASKKTDPAHCVFKTAFEGEGIDSAFVLKIPGRVKSSIDKALEWMNEAQLNDGGWGAGSHNRQDITNPHAVKSDP